MITPENNETTSIKGLFGYTALYDATFDPEIAAGVILAVKLESEICLFQTSTIVNVFMDAGISVIPGSMFEYLEGEVPGITEVLLEDCRYPTLDELNWYLKLDTV